MGILPRCGLLAAGPDLSFTTVFILGRPDWPFWLLLGAVLVTAAACWC